MPRKYTEAKKEYDRKWYQANKEAKKESDRKWRQENAEAKKEYDRKLDVFCHGQARKCPVPQPLTYYVKNVEGPSINSCTFWFLY